MCNFNVNTINVIHRNEGWGSFSTVIRLSFFIGIHWLTNKTIHRVNSKSRTKAHFARSDIAWLSFHCICVCGLAASWGYYFSIVLNPSYEFTTNSSLILVSFLVFYNILSYSSSIMSVSVYALALLTTVIMCGFFLGSVNNISTLSYFFLSSLVCVLLTRSFKNIKYGFENIFLINPLNHA